MCVSKSLFSAAVAAAMSSPSRVRVGAVLTKKKKLISAGVNLESKTHPKQAGWARKAGLAPKQYLHAEIAALARSRAPGDTIIVARVNPRGELRMARPCPICQLALIEAGVQKMWYSTDTGWVCEVL